MASPRAPISISIPAMSSHLAPIHQSSSSASQTLRERRGRSGSLVQVQEVGSADQDLLDQSAYTNLNPEWVNGKGAWLIHPFLVLVGKVAIDNFPGMTQPMSWTIVNLSYCMVSYLMFHYVTGTPFGTYDHSGAYDDLTMWEQIDEGAQYTPAKKWLVCMPIALFLISTHYTQYDPWAFAINFTALVVVLVAKLPQVRSTRATLVISTHPTITPRSPQ
ncbi:Orm1 type endoplasmic reticulum protein [Clavulina sp. PMI_390]|nr:Orm1 type endoplasmic reticulum protein [Clavulina sp. PMI_390]